MDNPDLHSEELLLGTSEKDISKFQINEYDSNDSMIAIIMIVIKYDNSIHKIEKRDTFYPDLLGTHIFLMGSHR